MNEPPLHICVVGLGYIGLPTAAVIASTGMRVTGMDVAPHVVETINRGDVHIVEKDLDHLVRRAVEGNLLTASTQVTAADVFIIAVPTPFLEDGKHTPDISLVLQAAETIAPVLAPGNLIVLESTSPAGTTECLRDRIAALRPDLRAPFSEVDAADIAIAYCPERVLPGKILEELRSNDRSIGGITPACTERAIAFYKRFVAGDCTATTARTAEMVKLTENAFRDVNIAFANELSIIADRLGIDVWDVIALANRHPRVNILQPGPGVGGHCIAVDPWFIVHGAPEEARLIRTAREVNDGKRDYVLARARRMLADSSAKLACLGLAFKPNIDDFRESPALKIAEDLAREFADRIMVVDPYCAALPRQLAGTGARLVELDEALERCEAILLLVDHDEFKAVLTSRLADKTIYDTRGAWHYPHG
jgi:UDP-N-acetyl-D-mannosaminuronic acid dehydrogenase